MCLSQLEQTFWKGCRRGRISIRFEHISLASHGLLKFNNSHDCTNYDSFVRKGQRSIYQAKDIQQKMESNFFMNGNIYIFRQRINIQTTSPLVSQTCTHLTQPVGMCIPVVLCTSALRTLLLFVQTISTEFVTSEKLSIRSFTVKQTQKQLNKCCEWIL